MGTELHWFYPFYDTQYHRNTSLETAMRQHHSKHAQRLKDGRIIVGYRSAKTGQRNGLVE